ncbi:MAG: hypothetical protein ACJ0DG_10085 [bacterium]
MYNIFAKLSHFFSRLNLYCAILGAALLFFIATIICLEVTGRALGASSRLWVLRNQRVLTSLHHIPWDSLFAREEYACGYRHCLH